MRRRLQSHVLGEEELPVCAGLVTVKEWVWELVGQKVNVEDQGVKAKRDVLS